jgi:hypothetical protein
LVIVVTKDTVITANFSVGIEEVIKSGTVSVLPNPTRNDFVISFDVIKSGDMRIVLTDLSGREVLDIYDGFVSDGMFTHTVTTSNFARGIYLLNILIDGNSTVEKVVLE